MNVESIFQVIKEKRETVNNDDAKAAQFDVGLLDQAAKGLQLTSPEEVKKVITPEALASLILLTEKLKKDLNIKQ